MQRKATKKGQMRQKSHKERCSEAIWLEENVYIIFPTCGEEFIFLKNYIKPVIGVHYDVVGAGSGGGRNESCGMHNPEP